MGIKAEVVISQDNKVIHKQRANTLVRAFFQILTVQLSQASVANVIDTSGTARTVILHQNNFALHATSHTTYGIVVGSGTSSWSFTDFRLASQIATLFHGNCQTSFTDNKLIVMRSFLNNTSSSVTITEVGIYVIAIESGNITRYFCIDRTLLSQSIVLEPARSLSVAYEITYA